MDEKIKELAKWYKTYGYYSSMCRLAEQMLVDGDIRCIIKAREISEKKRTVA